MNFDFVLFILNNIIILIHKIMILYKQLSI